MSTAKIVGIFLIVAGGFGLLYGGFSYTRDTQSAKVGPFVLQMQEKETVQVPVLLSAGALALGLYLLVAFRRK